MLAASRINFRPLTPNFGAAAHATGSLSRLARIPDSPESLHFGSIEQARPTNGVCGTVFEMLILLQGVHVGVLWGLQGCAHLTVLLRSEAFSTTKLPTNQYSRGPAMAPLESCTETNSALLRALPQFLLLYSFTLGYISYLHTTIGGPQEGPDITVCIKIHGYKEKQA